MFPVHYILDGKCSCGKADCNSPGKHPFERLVPKGLKDATISERTIEEWWTEESNANVAVRTGPESDIWILDVDGVEGIRALNQIEDRKSELPETALARSGGGGKHFFWSFPDDLDVRNKQRLAGLPLDVRGSGGFVVVPSSSHVSGNSYSWERSVLKYDPELLLLQTA